MSDTKTVDGPTVAELVSTMPEQPKPKYAGFVKGQSGNPKGRPKGSRNKLGQLFIEKMHEDFKANGTAAIEKVRIERPAEYLKVIASILPKELNVRTDPLEELSQDELDSRIQHLAAFVNEYLGGEAGVGARVIIDGEAHNAEPAEELQAISETESVS